MKNLVLIILLCLFLNGTAAAQTQQIPDFQTIKTDKGMVILNNNPAQSFSFLVAGKNPTGSQNNDCSLLIETDSNIVLVYFVKTKDFLAAVKTTGQTEILQAHRDWDIAAQEKARNAKLNVDVKQMSFVTVQNLQNQMFPKKLISTAYWSYTSPDTAKPSRSFYQTVLLGDMILMIGTNLNISVKVEQVRDRFSEVLQTLTLLPPQQKNVLPKKLNKLKKKQAD